MNLTYGLNFEIHRNSLLTLGFVTPITGPPVRLQGLVLFSYRFGRSANAPRRRSSRVRAVGRAGDCRPDD